MTILFIGLLLFLLAPKTPELFPQIAGITRIVRLTGLGLIVVGLANATVKQIEAGHVGVQSLFGKVQERTLNSGLNFINPFVAVNVFDIKTQNYTMSSIATEGDKTGDDAIRVRGGEIHA